MAKNTFYVTTAIDYVSAEPHIGHAYQKIVADVLARWNKIKGKEVFYVTGTDEHGKKVQRAAEKAGKKPKQFVDDIARKYKRAWKALNIEPDRFIRTTDKDHEKVVIDFIKKCNRAGDIYKGRYSGLYCTDCEAYYTEKDSENGCCPVHKKKLEKLEEESYFFKLSKYQGFLLDLYKEHLEFILPSKRRNEVISKVKEGLRDFSITRTSFDWGIPFPLEKGHVIYVWFDALINYYTAARKKGKEKFWPADVHLLGKDNTWFHTVYWPAMLKSAGIKLPKIIFNHGFLTFNNQKISKSLGNSISPVVLVEKYGADTVRYFTLRQIPFSSGDDGNFSERDLINRHNNELADKLGNLVSRTTALAEKHGLKEVNFRKVEADIDISNVVKDVSELIERFEFDKALNLIFSFVDCLNQFVQDRKIWETGSKKDLFELAIGLRTASILLWPFIPEACEKIAKTFNFKVGENTFKDIKKPLKIIKIKKAEILFKKINTENNNQKENQKNDNQKQNINKQEKIIGIVKMGEISFNEWQKLDLRVAQITKVDDIQGADKLYKIQVDLGKKLGKRVICAGLKEHYSKQELKGKKIILFTNLTPRKMRGIESQGMLLAAVSEDHKKVILIAPEKDVELGSKVM